MIDQQYICKYFDIRELVSEAAYKARDERCWQLLDTGMLITLDQLRERFGPAVVNTWHSLALQNAYGFRSQSGLRDVTFYDTAEDYIKSHSQHKYGRGADVLFRNYSAEEVRKEVLSNPKDFPFLKAVELGVNWFHFDTRNCTPIFTFKP